MVMFYAHNKSHESLYLKRIEGKLKWILHGQGSIHVKHFLPNTYFHFLGEMYSKPSTKTFPNKATEADQFFK